MGRFGALATLVAIGGCQAPVHAPQPPPPVTLDLAAPWELVDQTDHHVRVRLGDSPDGVRIQLVAEDARVPGVSPIHGGRTLEAPDGGIWPLVAIAYPERPLFSVEIEVQGVDLVTRFHGPPLHAVSQHPEAPDDPVLTWVRVRRRPGDWRVVLDGLGTVSVSEPTVALAEGDGWAVGEMVLTTNAPRVHTGLGERWWMSVVPSLEATEPYPRTSLTLTP